MEHNAQKRPKSKTARTLHYGCAYVTVMAVLVIFAVILQTVISNVILSIGTQCEETICHKCHVPLFVTAT